MSPPSPRRIAVFLTAGCLVFTGCDVSGSKQPSKPSNPTSIAVGQTVSGSVPFALTSHPDTVHIAFLADSGTTYFFRVGSGVGHISEGIFSPAMTGSDYDMTAAISSGWRDSLTFPCIRSGSYQIVLFLSGYDLLPGDIDFKVDLAAKSGITSKYVLPDAYEPDDTKSTAKTIPADGSVQWHTIHGATTYPNDIDWIAIQCDSGNTYSVTQTIADGATSLSLFTPDSILLTPSDVSYGSDVWTGPNTYEFAALRSATYYVKVASGGGHASYSIAVTATPGLPAKMVPDAYEPDDTRATAKFIPTDSTVQSRSINSKTQYSTDLDWIAFQGVAGKTYTVHSSRDAQASPVIYVFSPDSVNLYNLPTTGSCTPDYGAGICTDSFTAAQSGTFYIRVVCSASIAYRIAVTSN